MACLSLREKKLSFSFLKLITGFKKRQLLIEVENELIKRQIGPEINNYTYLRCRKI
jgi:hypothetical protein